MPKKQTINLVNNIVSTAEKRGVAKLIIENKEFDGKNIVLEGKNLVSFGSYSYLGLEVDKRLKEGAVDAIQRYGVQYPTSRIYSSLPIYETLYAQFKEMFGAPVVLTTSLSLGHMGVMPVLIQKEDILILDQHVHSSVQDSAQRLRSQDVKVTIERHNDMEDLEKKIVEYSQKYRRVWYAIDGIYSMYGDCAPIKEIERLLNKYDSFYLYADDAHGISSFGPNGSGWVLSEIDFHPKMVLALGMAKAFGTMGGIFAIKDEAMYEKVSNCTGSLIFSGPHPIPILGASVVSADIHLSYEIVVRQRYLAEKIEYCHQLLKENGVPDISDRNTPIFFVAVGLLKCGYSLVKRMIDDGFFVNLASFPAVSETCTGVRFTITLHHSFEDIENLVRAFKRNFPLVLEEENRTVNDLRRAFRKVENFPKYVIGSNHYQKETELRMEYYTSIRQIDVNLWNSLFKNAETFDWNLLEIYEKIFVGNGDQNNNWDFHYFIVKDQRDEIVMATFFTTTVVKEDMLSSVEVSREMESQRQNNPHFLSSRTIMMGTLLTEGTHIYLDRDHYKWKKSLTMLLDRVEMIRERDNINSILLRDFDTADEELATFLKEYSFLKVDLPDTHYIDNFSWNDSSEFMDQFKHHRRKYLRKIVFKNEDLFNVQIMKEVTENDVDEFYQLYKNVNDKSLEINTFALPKKIFEEALKYGGWEVIRLSLKDDPTNKAVAMMFCYASEHFYYPALVGLNYKFISQNIYPQILWRTVKRAKQLNLKRLAFGYTAAQNKRKFGAKTATKCGYIQSKDNYNLMLVNLLEG